MRDQAADRLVGLAPCLVRLPLPNNSIKPPPLRFAPLAPCSASGTPAGAPWVSAEGGRGRSPPVRAGAPLAPPATVRAARSGGRAGVRAQPVGANGLKGPGIFDPTRPGRRLALS